MTSGILSTARSTERTNTPPAEMGGCGAGHQEFECDLVYVELFVIEHASPIGTLASAVAHFVHGRACTGTGTGTGTFTARIEGQALALLFGAIERLRAPLGAARTVPRLEPVGAEVAGWAGQRFRRAYGAVGAGRARHRCAGASGTVVAFDALLRRARAAGAERAARALFGRAELGLRAQRARGAQARLLGFFWAEVTRHAG